MAKIYTTDSASRFTYSGINTGFNTNSGQNGLLHGIPLVLPPSILATREIDLEKETQNLKSRKRRKMYEDILHNVAIDVSWFKPIAHTFGGIAGCLISDCFLLVFDEEAEGNSSEWLLIPPPCGDTNCSFPSGKGANGRP